MARAPHVAVLALLSWVVVTAAAWRDPEHDLLAHYISWLIQNDLGAFGVAGLLGVAAAAALEALHLHRVLDAGPVREAVVAFLVCASLLVLGTLVLPSRGFGEPLWRTALHVGLAVGAYAGTTGAALLVGWATRLADRAMKAWAVLLVLAQAALLVLAAWSRFVPEVQLRGLGQIVLMGAAAAWLAAASLHPADGSS